MGNLLKTNKPYPAKIKGHIVFTKEGAVNYYKKALEVAYEKFDLNAIVFLNEIEENMINIGFTRQEIEEIETNYIKEI